MAWKVVGSVLVVVVLLVLALAGVGYYFSNLLTTPAEPFSVKDIEVSAADESSVTVTWNEFTTYPGLHGLVWDDGHAYLGEQLATQGTEGDGTITYEVVDVDRGALEAGLDAAWSAWYFDGDPTVRGLGFETVTPRSDVGELASWYVPGDGDTWTIVVHGINGDRGESLRVLPTLAEVGSPTLAIRYRNDTGIPTTDNLLRLGDTEWRDVEAAMDWARERGAQKFVVYGFSYGGAITLQTLARAEGAEDIVGLVLDAPVISWQDTLDFQATARGLPTFVATVGGAVTELRLDLDLDDFDWVSRADELDVPILIFHGPDDSFVPWGPSQQLAELRPDIVTLEQVDAANHTRSWNTGPERYEKAVSDFVARVGEQEPAAG